MSDDARALRWHIELLAAGLDGGSRREVCPSCRGGSTRERSLRVSRNGARYSATCFRATCGLQMAGTLGGAADAQTRRSPKLYSAADLALQTLWLDEVAYFRSRFQILPKLARQYLRVASDGDNSGFAFLAQDFAYQQRAVIVRRKPWAGVPECPLGDIAAPSKTKTYRLLDCSPWGVVAPDGADLWLVEDFVSALRIASAEPTYSAVVLGGTHMPEDLVAEVMSRSFRSITLALDPDAAKQSMAVLRKWCGALPALRVKFLTQDPKDCPLDELVVPGGR